MFGRLTEAWPYVWSEVWAPLENSDVWPEVVENLGYTTDDLYTDLYVELAKALKKAPQPIIYDAAANDATLARDSLQTTPSAALRGESATIRFLEDAFDVIAESGSAELENEYRILVDRLLTSRNLRYRLREPFHLDSHVPGVFAALFSDVLTATIGSQQLTDALRDFEYSFQALGRSQLETDMKTCILKATMLVEALASTSPGAQGKTLSDLCNSLKVWPHPALKDAVSKIYGFCSDYPGIRHNTGTGGQLRNLEMRDSIIVPLLLFAAAGYFGPNADLLDTLRGRNADPPQEPPDPPAITEEAREVNHSLNTRMSHFGFLNEEWVELCESAVKAESLARPDPRTSCFYARPALELAVHWLYKSDATLKLPHGESLSALIFESTFRDVIGSKLLTKVRIIKDLGNLAVHSYKPIRETDSLAAVRELFQFCFWIARTYARGQKPPDGMQFKPELLPSGVVVLHQTIAQLQKLEEELRAKDEKLVELLEGKKTLDEELRRLREEVATAKKANSATPDNHDYSEAETRDYFIDFLLKEAGWALTEARDREFPVSGMPNQAKEGFVDYVLWGDDGKPLGLVEAKRTKRDARVGQQQARLYADCLEAKFSQRPVIFYSNGYQHWIWDDLSHPPRAVQGFYKKDELELLIQRRATRRKLAEAEISKTIVERYYQTRAIRRVSESFEQDNSRKALLVMATGSGKTRVVIALCDLLMRCNWAKRILFLADRLALVNQAVNTFKQHLPDSSPVNLVTEKDKQGRVYGSTYPTMMGLIDQAKGGQKQFGVGHFDLVIIDEAHRSVYQKYGAIFDYFDSYLVGLTATPKDEVDHNTYSLFELQDGVPTEAYPLEDAVKDGFLVPMKAVAVPLKFQREGIKYDDLSEEEKEEWDAKEWSEDGEVPDRVEAEAVNKWLFNRDTVDKVLAHLMTRGQKVGGGDRLGKTNHLRQEPRARRLHRGAV